LLFSFLNILAKNFLPVNWALGELMEQNLRRGWMLTTFLLFIIILSVAAVIGYIFLGEKMNGLYPTWVLFSLLIDSVLRGLSAIAVWFWSKSGVILYATLSAISTSIMVYFGFNQAYLGIGGALVLILLVKSKWQYMSWGVIPP
jgi:hypothetical protein